MLIGVDCGCLGIVDRDLEVGVYQVAVHLLRELSKIDNHNTYHLYSFNPIPRQIMDGLGANMKNLVVKPKRGWFNLGLPIQFIRSKPDVFLALSQVMPWYHPFKTIGMVHGLDMEKDYHPGSFNKLNSSTLYLINNADKLVTTSIFLKQNILKVNPEAKIEVCNLGVDKVFSPNGEVFKRNNPYFLFVGALKITKNIPRILEAFSLLLK